VEPLTEKVGDNSIRISWRPPANGGSPLLGYQVEMEANGDGFWETVYDGTNRPSVTSYLATGLHDAIQYRFRVYAENRVGRSSPAKTQVKVADLKAAHQSRVKPLTTSLTADAEYTIDVVSADPISGVNELVGGRTFVLSLHNVCELDITRTICLRVEDSHPHYEPDVVVKPICCIESEDNDDGSYRFTYTPRYSGKYSVNIQALESGGLLGQYWDNQWLYGEPVLTRQDSDLSFDWGMSAIALHASDFISVRWSGYVKPDYSEMYTFYIDVDDAARLWVNGVLLFDKWDKCCQEFWGQAQLTAGQFASIQLEYREVAGNAKMKLTWSSFRQPKSPIPPGKLFKAPYVSNVPQLVQVFPGQTSPGNTIAYGEYLSRARCLETRSFFIQAKDTAGNFKRSANDMFHCIICECS
jgi:hypothetical protein